MWRLAILLLIGGCFALQASARLALGLFGLAVLVWALYLLDLFWKILTGSDKSWWE